MPSVQLPNVTFVQISKNAGTSIGNWLIDHHSPVVETWYNHPKASELPGEFKFAVVRNPWDRLVSLYSFLKNWTSPVPGTPESESARIRNGLCILNNYTEFPDFNTWIVDLHEFRMLQWLWWGPLTNQTEWLDTKVDLVLYYENIVEDFKQIQDLLGNTNPLPRDLASIRREYQYYYTDATKKFVAKAFESDIDTWKYQF